MIFASFIKMGFISEYSILFDSTLLYSVIVYFKSKKDIYQCLFFATGTHYFKSFCFPFASTLFFVFSKIFFYFIHCLFFEIKMKNLLNSWRKKW